MSFTRSDSARESYLEDEKIEAAEPDLPVRHGMVIRLLKEMQHITHEDTGFAGLQALGERAVFCETGFGQDYVTSEQMMKALEAVGHPFRLEDVSELHAIRSNGHLNFVVAVIGPWVQLKRS